MPLRWFGRSTATAPVNSTPATHIDKGQERFGLEIVGESHYQDALRRSLKSASDSHGRKVVRVLVQREPTNAFDPDAIRISHPTHGLLGYLSRGEAKRYTSHIARFEAAGLTVTCTAMLAGGSRDKPSIGAWLNLPWPTKANWTL